ncbi:serine-rich adhesin for platelets isoform X5 [Drosophila eugracilis]|uniref:serine-rich adhesin for platelets isoform X5 n=1 Tax=Drosophila eugracilis TaxID=29029 RepID=UPI0007E76D8B|nr:serine-rich adhesin for platelets isoform X5 [Drosophila eugracilis]
MAGEAPAATSPAACNISNSKSNIKESSPDPAQQQLNSSVDSGIAVLEAETPTLRRRQRLSQCQRILLVLQRDHLTHQQLRDRLSKLANKKWRKEEKDASEDRTCNVCCADLDLGSAKNYVTCCTCGKSVCRGPKCADWRPKDAKWECQLCQSSKESLAHTSSWVAEQMSFNQHKFVYPMRARSEVYIPIVGDGNDSSMQFESVSQIGQTANLDERAKIREYVEEIVAEMLGGNLDHIKVGQLSKSENYLQLFDKFHAKLSNLLINVENNLCARALNGDLPAIVNGQNNGNGLNHNNNNNNNNNAESELADISQTRLRSLIETIIAETLRNSSLSISGAVSEISLDTRSHASELANGNGMKRRHRTEHYFEPKIYQDLLATAVLNKIADKEGNTRLLAESTPDLSGRHIDENFNAEALSTTSGSSIEPRSDSSLTDHEIGLDNGKSKSLQTDLERESVLSDYIAAHMVPLPDFSASVTESEDDIGSISSGMIGDGNWEDNWLFKKKRSSATPSSIGMLVPAPTENVRAQIGDKTTDEISDLSEIGSDIEESSLDLLRCNDLNDRLLSQHLIGGQNTKLVLDELVDRTSLTSHTLLEEHEPAFTETTNEFVVSPMAVPSDIKAPSPTPPPPPMIFQDDLLKEEEPDHTPIADQLSSESIKSDESEPSTACETFNGDGDSEQEFVSERALVLDNQRSLNTNTNSNNNLHAQLHLPLTQTNNPATGSRRTNGKLTNGSLRWSGSYSTELPNGGSIAAQQDDVADDDVVLLRRFVPGSIAEREVKKWYNAVEMPNNPYAPEALKQRISGTQERYMDVPNISPSAEHKALASALTENPDPPSPKTDYKRYSRDYYINNAPTPTDSTGSGKAAAPISAEDVEDIVINEAQKASKPATEQEPPQESVFKAVPVQILDESLDSQSNPSLYSLQTTTTTTSDESDTVRIYDFNKQETTVIKAVPAEQQPSTSTTSSMESAQSATPSVSSIDSSVSKKRERPVVLQFGPGDSAPTIGSPASTPTRGSTPPAFRFLQPKRRLIDPSQVLSVDEDDVPEPTTPASEKPVIEDEVAHSMPSVKALAQAFLLTSKHTQPQRRWRAKVRIAAPPDTPDKPNTSLAKRHKLEHAVSMAEVADESTIASDLSSLETDPSIHSENTPPIASPASPVPVRHGFLRSNIAFFENLKFK